jgi:hypothetical protein
VVLAKYHDIIQTLSTNRADHASSVGILPRRSWRDRNLVDRKCPRLPVKGLAIDCISTSNQVLRPFSGLHVDQRSVHKPRSAQSKETDALKPSFSALSVLLLTGSQAISGTALAQQRPASNPANAFTSEDTDSFDPGLPVGARFPPIRAFYHVQEITDIDQFIPDNAGRIPGESLCRLVPLPQTAAR